LTEPCNMSITNPGLARLQKHFGIQYDVDVLLSVLAVCDGNADQAITFLTAHEGDVVDDPARANQESIPADYPARQPTGRVPIPAKVDEKEKVDKELTDRIAKIKKLFVTESVLSDHHGAQTSVFPEYISCLYLLLHQGVELSKSSRPRIRCWLDIEKD